MNIAIVDDSDEERKNLQKILQDWAEDRKIPLLCDLYADGDDFLTAGRKYEAVFLDVYMERTNGIDTARQLRERDSQSQVVFLTVSSEFRAEAFGVHAFDYLEKPAAWESVTRVMTDLLRYLPGASDRLLIPVGKTQLPVTLSRLRQVTSDGNYCFLCMEDGRQRVRVSFSVLENLLKSDGRFLRVNRGILVNMDFVRGIENSSCIMKDGETFPVNVKKVSQLKKELVYYQFELRDRMLSGRGR